MVSPGPARTRVQELFSRIAGLPLAGRDREQFQDAADAIEKTLEQNEADLERALRRLDRLTEAFAQLEDRLNRVENSLIFRLLRGIGQTASAFRRRAGQWLLHSPFHGLYLKVAPPVSRKRDYATWVRIEEAALPPRAWHEDQVRQWTSPPLISVVMATYQPKREWLAAAIDSVANQFYPNWELCVCDDVSDAWVADYLRAREREEPRIRVAVAAQHSGIAGALNKAGELARGEFVVFLDHDDVLAPRALFRLAEAMRSDPADIFYTDEDHLDPDGERADPRLKPGWSPDLLATGMYFGHCMAVRRQRLDQAGWFREGFDGAQDYDLALRLTDDPAVRVRHVGSILYHWRRHPTSTAASSEAKPYTHEAGKRALESALQRRRLAAKAADGPIPNLYSIEWAKSNTSTSIVVCSRRRELMERFLRSLAPSRSASLQIVVVHHEESPDPAMRRLLEDAGCERVPYVGRFHFSLMNNLGVQAASGEHLIFLNDDVEPISPSWLDTLGSQLSRPEIGIVGAKLLYPSGMIQHAGVTLGMMEGAGHPGRGLIQSDLWPWLDRTREVSAVTGACLGIRREVFDRAGGFDAVFPVNYNDVDLCLRVRQMGLRVLYDPRILMRHAECQTRQPGTKFAERERFRDRWGALLQQPDPFWSPILRLDTEEIALREPGDPT